MFEIIETNNAATSNVAGGAKTPSPRNMDAKRRTIIHIFPPKRIGTTKISSKKNTMPAISPAHNAALQSITSCILNGIFLFIRYPPAIICFNLNTKP